MAQLARENFLEVYAKSGWRVSRLDFTRPERIGCTYEEHAALLRAVLTGKSQQAEMLIGTHIEASKLEVRKISLHRLHLAQIEAASRAAGARA